MIKHMNIKVTLTIFQGRHTEITSAIAVGEIT